MTTILRSGTQPLAKAGAIMKRLQSTETLGSTSAINSDKTGTLTLNQMTAVEMARSRAADTPSRAAATPPTARSRTSPASPTVPLDPFLLPMVLASDAVRHDDGELIGDPTEGALVVLAAKGGVDVDVDPRSATRASPSCRSTPPTS